MLNLYVDFLFIHCKKKKLMKYACVGNFVSNVYEELFTFVCMYHVQKLRRFQLHLEVR